MKVSPILYFFLFISLLAIELAIGTGCAQIGAPTGGPRDTNGPRDTDGPCCPRDTNCSSWSRHYACSTSCTRNADSSGSSESNPPAWSSSIAPVQWRAPSAFNPYYPLRDASASADCVSRHAGRPVRGLIVRATRGARGKRVARVTCPERSRRINPRSHVSPPATGKL